MKKLLLLLTLITGLSSAAWAAVCTPDSAAFTPGVIVYPSALPVYQGVAFSGTVSIKVPDSLDASAYDAFLPPNTYYVYIDSIRVDSATGAPAGISATTSPGGTVWLHPGQYACIQFSGTTTAASGSYPIAAFGGACVHGNILGYALDSCETGQLPSPAFFSFSLHVSAPPVCTPDTAGFGPNQSTNPTSLPCIFQNVPYSGTYSLKVTADSIDAYLFDTLVPPGTYVYIDSLVQDSLTGAPAGITVLSNPVNGVWMYAGQYGCDQVSGTTTAPTGSYTLHMYGTGCLHGTVSGTPFHRCYSGELPAYFSYTLGVCPTPPCIPDSAAQPRAGISPSANNLPCIVDGTPINVTLQVQCPTVFDTLVNIVITSYPLAVTIDSMELDSVINLPAGITWVKFPDRLRGGQNGCITFSGTTTAPPGYYHLTWYGTAWVTEPDGLGNKTVVGSLNRYDYVDYYLNVIASAGDSCIPYNPYNGISNVNPVLNTALDVYPNPSNGIFTLKLNAGSRVSGQVEVIDVTGRIVFAQDVDLIGQQNMSMDLSKCAKGIYNILLKTAAGNATRRISID